MTNDFRDDPRKVIILDTLERCMERTRVFSGAPWEKEVGYCRAVKVGNHIFVSGTAPMINGNVVASGDAYGQAKHCFEIISEALTKLDCPLSAVVRTRMFVTDMSRWREFGKAHAEFFGEYPPATSMLEVKALINAEMLIEVEADAITSC